MQTFLIASTNQTFVETGIKNITKDLKVSPLNLMEINPATSLVIADVRKISQTILLKPYGGGDRVIIIRGMEKATPEAANALLKILEEPPAGNFLILTTDNMNKLLPTIVSRCQVITDNNKKLSEIFDSRETKKLLTQILKTSAGERILLTQKISNSREEGIQLLTNLLFTLEELLHKPDKEINLTPPDLAQLIKKVATAKNYLERYINFKATLDILFLGFPKTN